MAAKEIKVYPDPVLRELCKPVECFDEKVSRLLDDLGESMYAFHGIGLAAPQIGEVLRVAVVDVEQREGTPRLIELINPEVVVASEEMSKSEEGCLSFPQETELVNRPARITVRALDRKGAPFEIIAEGLLAKVIQHEIDHLNGRLFIDRLSRLKRSLVERRMEKRARSVAS